LEAAIGCDALFVAPLRTDSFGLDADI